MSPPSASPHTPSPAGASGEARRSLLEAARALAPELSARAQDAEKQRTMPPDLVEKVRAAGLFHLSFPKALGGHEVDPLTFFEVLEELSRADGSAGWTVMIGNATAVAAWLAPEIARAMVAARPAFTVASVFGNGGSARIDERDGSFVIDGRWSMASGCRHADWFMGGFLVMDGDAPRIVDNKVDWRIAIFPQRDAEVLDTWTASGLRGTGSHDVVAKGIRVRPEYTVRPFFEPPSLGGPFYRFPLATMQSCWLGGFLLGIARRALDEFTQLAARKSRTVTQSTPMADQPTIQLELARAEAAVRSARAFVLESLEGAWQTVSSGESLTLAQRGLITMATLNAARSARLAVDSVFSHAGASALYDQSPLQRCARDIAAGTQHLFLSLGQWEGVGAILLGREPKTTLI